MSDIKTYTLENYVPGRSTFEVSLGDIFVVPNNEALKSIDYVSISNTGIIQCKKEGSGTNTKFIFTPTSNIKEPNHKYDVTVKFTLTTEISSDDNTTSVKTRDCFIKLILIPEINDNTSRLNIINYMGKLSPDEYMKEHSLKDDLDSLVTKKALITNLKEFGKQVQNKVSNVQVFAIRYDLEGGNWNNGNEGRTSFVNSISYVAPAPVKTGYIFNGWKLFKINDDKETATALNNGNITTDSMIPVGTSFDVLCVADWVRIAYELKLYDAANIVYFNPKDVDYSKNPKLKDITIVENNGDGNSKTISLVTPEKAGYTFKYWTTTNKYGQIITCKNDQNINEVYDQVFEASNDTDTRIIELTPYFEAKVYTLNYNLSSDNATLDDSLTDSSKKNEYVYGTTFTLPIPRRNGYKFDGWTIGSLVNQFVINPTDLEKITTSTIEVKASWTATTFHLDFDLQNGSIADNSNYTLKANTPIVLSNPIRPGYIFNGWEYNSADGSVTLDNTTKKYIFTPSDTVDHDITLKAIWKASEETEYTLQIWEETSDSTGTFTSAEDDTCVYRLTKSITKTGKTGTDTGFTASNLGTKSGYSIPDGFTLSKIENVSIKADGTSIVKVYIHRNICTITIIDKYDTTSSSSFTDRTYTSLYRTDINSIGTATTNKISGKFGQTLIAYPIFNNTYPELNYTCNTSGKSLVFNTTSQTVTFTYTKKNVRVTFDLNNVGTWTIGDTKFNSDIYSIDIPYGAILDNSHIPSVTNYNVVASSKWLIESTSANNEISDFTKYKFTKDTKIRRIPTFYNNKIIISTENYDETNFGITNVINSAYYTTNGTNYLSTSIRPIELLTPAFDAYNFIGYKYKFGENSSFSDKYIMSINKDIWTATSANNDLYIMACFERKEPTLDLSRSSVTYTDRTLTIQNVILGNGATKFYISSTVPNANVSTNLGNESSSATNGKHSASISGSFATDKNHNTIVLIPSKETDTVKIAGKPFIGTISEIGTNTVTVSWIQSYQVYDNQDDASISSISISGSKNHTNVDEPTTIKVTTNAEKVLVNKNGSLNIADVENNETTFTIENNFVKATTRNASFSEAIQLTPIRYNKTGKSSIVRALKTSTNVDETASGIIAFKDNDGYYYSSNYGKVTSADDLLGLQTPTSFNDTVILESDSSISIDNKTTSVPSKNNIEATQISLEYYYEDGSVFTYNDSKDYSINTSSETNIISARGRGITLYAQDGSVITGLYRLGNGVPSNSSISITNEDGGISRLISLSKFSINNLNNTPSITTGINLNGTIYYENVIKSGGESTTYTVPGEDGNATTVSTTTPIVYTAGFDNRSASTFNSITISNLNNITYTKILSKSSHKIAITLPSGFYIYENSMFQSIQTVYIDYNDLTISEVETNTVSNNGAETNLCNASTLTTSNTYNTSNYAKFIKKAGGTSTAKVKIPVTKYSSINYSYKDTINTDIRTKANISTNVKLNKYKIFDNPTIVIETSDSTLIPYNTISLSNEVLQVKYNTNKFIQRQYSAYTTEIETYL